MKNITIRDSGNKEVLEAYFLNHEGQPYNLENKTVTFMENKDGDKFVSDPNVQIVNATAGFVRYTLQSQVHSAPGIAWFEINDDSGLVDSTGNFNIRVENGLRATADNTTYIGALEKLKQQMEALIQQADGELKAELQKAEQQLNQELQNFRNQYNSLSADFQNQFKTAQNARQQDYNNQKNAINQDWTNNKNSIWEQWNNDKANIDKQAQDTVQAIKDNAKQVLDEDQANWNAKQTQWDSTFSAIVKEWQVKTNSLNSTVQDLTNKFNTIIGQVSDLMNNKLPAMDSKTDAIQAKIDELRKELPNLNKIKLRTQSLDQSGNTFENIQTATKQSDGSYQLDLVDNDWTAYKVNWLLNNTSSYNIKSNTDLNDIKAPGLYHCSGASNITNMPSGVDPWFNMVVNSGTWNGSQALYATDRNQLYVRTWTNRGFKQWRRIINEGDLNRSLLPLSGGIMNKGAFINWNGSDSNSAKDGHLGGIQWTGATDSIQIYGDNNAADNLDLAIQLGDDNSNRISIRDKDGTERAAITADGYYTGTIDWANVMNTGIDNPTLGRYISQSNTWNDIIGQDNGKNTLAAIRDQSHGQGNTIGNYSSGIVFGGGDTKGMLNVAYDSPQARIIGGNGNAPVWKKDIAWKDDLKVNVVRSYDIEKNQNGPVTSETLGHQWLVDKDTLATFADAHRDVRNHTDFRYPTDTTSNTAINLNNDPYLDTGIYKIANCAIINGPWADVDTRRWFYLTVIKFDNNSIYQTVDQGPERFARNVSKTANSYPLWSKFATMDSITDLSDRLRSFTMQLRGFTMQQAMFQHRVDYESPSGTISNQTVDFNNYRETGILKVVNCLIQNGPYKSENRHTLFLKITNLDGQTQYQTVYEGDNLYGRKLYNGSGQWHKYTNTPI